MSSEEDFLLEFFHKPKPVLLAGRQKLALARAENRKWVLGRERVELKQKRVFPNTPQVFHENLCSYCHKLVEVGKEDGFRFAVGGLVPICRLCADKQHSLMVARNMGAHYVR